MVHISVLLVSLLLIGTSFSKVIQYEAEDAHVTGAGYSEQGFAHLGSQDAFIHAGLDVETLLDGKESVLPGKILFVCNIAEDGDYLVTMRHMSTQGSALKVKANGHHLLDTQLGITGVWLDKQESLTLRQGVNTIVYEMIGNLDIVMVDYITIEGAIPLAPRGATLPYFEIEAEDAATNGVVIGPDRTYTKLPSEASGRKAVQITGSQYVEFTLTGTANGIVIRYSIPDAPQGQGQNGVLGMTINGNTKNLPVTSHFSWSYGSYPFNKSPGSGTPHHFYDEIRVSLGSTLPAGTKVRFQGMTNLVYTIDLVDFYTIPAAYPMPANFLNVVTYGADPLGQKDSTQAFQKALTDGASQNKGVWIPAGNFLVNQRFTLGKVVVRGAGPWYSTVTATQNHGLGFFANFGANPNAAFELYDFAMTGDTNDRDDGAIDSGMGGSPSSVVVQNVWIEHTKCGMWLDGPFADLSVVGVTIRNTFADGINLHIGATNVVIQQSIFRNLGDDALAMWSQNQPDRNNVLKFNTIQVPVLANGIGIYGGSDNSGTDNVISDTICEGAGLQASNRFGSVALGGTTTFERNTVLRCGSAAHDNSSWDGAVWFWAQDSNIEGNIVVKDIEIIESSWAAILFWGAGTQIHNMNFSNITIDGTVTYAIEVQGPLGEASFDHVVAKNLRWGGLCNYEPNGFTIKYGEGNVGWDTTSKCYSR